MPRHHLTEAERLTVLDTIREMGDADSLKSETYYRVVGDEGLAVLRFYTYPVAGTLSVGFTCPSGFVRALSLYPVVTRARVLSWLGGPDGRQNVGIEVPRDVDRFVDFEHDERWPLRNVVSSLFPFNLDLAPVDGDDVVEVDWFVVGRVCTFSELLANSAVPPVPTSTPRPPRDAYREEVDARFRAPRDASVEAKQRAEYVASFFRSLGHVLVSECELGRELDDSLRHLELSMIFALRSFT